jgi:hypothetical protein
LVGNERFDTDCDAVGNSCDVIGNNCDVIGDSCDVIGDARLSFDAALSDDSSEESGFEPQPVLSPPSSASPEPTELPDVRKGKFLNYFVKFLQATTAA